MMRPFLLVVALLPCGLAAIGSGGATAAVPDAEHHQIGAVHSFDPAAFLHSQGGLVSASVGGQSLPGPALGRKLRSAGPASQPPPPTAADASAFEAAVLTSRRYTAPSALARAGRLAFPTTAPPPFPFVRT